MDLNFYSDLSDGTGQHSDSEFLDSQSYNGYDSVNKAVLRIIHTEAAAALVQLRYGKQSVGQQVLGGGAQTGFPGGSDNYLTIPGAGHPFLSSSEVQTLLCCLSLHSCAPRCTPTVLLSHLSPPPSPHLSLLIGSHTQTFHTPSLGDEEFEIPPISLDPDSALSVSDVVSHFGELSEGSGVEDTSVRAAVVGGNDPSFASTFVNPPSQGLEHLSLGVMNQPGGGALLSSSLGMDLGHSIGSHFSSSSPMTIDVPLSDMSHGLLGHNQLTTIDQSELSSQLGLSLGGGTILPRPQSPEQPLSATPSPAGSLQDEDLDDFKQKAVLVDSPASLSISLSPSVSTATLPSSTAPVVRRGGGKPAMAMGGAGGGAGGVGGGAQKRIGRKKKDPNEPQKPVSAYALFFRDTQAAIKGQNPSATFGEVSKIVASMWDSLGEEQKQVYKRKTEAAKKEYLKALAAYRANQLSQVSSSPPISCAHKNNAPTPGPSPSPAPNPPTVTKIIISKQALGGALAAGGGAGVQAQQIPASLVTVVPASSRAPGPAPSRQPPPLQQMQTTPPPPRLQQMVHSPAPPPLQAKPRGGGGPGPGGGVGAVSVASTPPPPLQIKIVPAPLKAELATPFIVTTAAAAVSAGSSSVSTPAAPVQVVQSAVDMATTSSAEDMVQAEELTSEEVRGQKCTAHLFPLMLNRQQNLCCANRRAEPVLC
ncbi:hypothetical protein JZ751_016286 [Albula glossodonta]|uniref:HMG box domain-containing protein n=1 Tax=Albula glossodonta TaxID=121402 RepID=A0A8T2MUI9_9TELE|nr:hypothetical protein JZ751_016286 [Albula glossodonta]